MDKLEQLLSLTYGDGQSDTTTSPSVNTGGTGLTIGGTSSPATPVVGYADYLDRSGSMLCTVASPCTATPPAGWFYKRVWQVSTPSANLKQITVTAIVATSFAGAQLSQSTVSTYKTGPRRSHVAEASRSDRVEAIGDGPPNSTMTDSARRGLCACEQETE